jgi:hypothetical protein
MAGNIFFKEASVVVLQNDNGGSFTTTPTSLATNLDNRNGGNAAENFWASFELKCGFGSASGIVGKTVDLYLVPALDGTNFADVDTSAPTMPLNNYVGSFTIVMNQTSVQRLTLIGVPVQPLLYKGYLVNNSGQTLSANWGCRVVTAMEQYS